MTPRKMDKELEKKLWDSADILRGNISSEQYMYIIIGIMFLKHMSDKYDNAINLINEKHKNSKYFLKNIIILKKYNSPFIIPKKSHWKYISQNTNNERIGEIIDDAFNLIEDENKELRGLFDKNYNREELDQKKLGMLVSNFSNIDLSKFGEDITGRIFEYFLGQFFKKQGQKGGEFYTPQSIVILMVKILKIDKGKVYDPCCGTGGMFIQSKIYIENSGGNYKGIVVYGQEYLNKIWKLAQINLLINGFYADSIKIGHKSADTFSEDLHKNEKFDFILANPPFNIKKWGQEKLIEDERWKWGIPPKGNANYAWLSHMVSKLNNKGKAAIILANGSLSSNQKSEKEIRKNFLEKNKVDAIIKLPDKLFFTTQIPASIWIFNNNKINDNILMISASDLEGHMLSKKLRELTKENIEDISKIYEKHLNNEQINVKGFAKTVTKKEIEEYDLSFVPGQYVDIIEEVVDVELTKEEIRKSFEELEVLLKEFDELRPKVKESIKKILEDKNNKDEK